MKKRFFALILSLLIVLSNYPITTAFALDSASIESVELTATRTLVENFDGYPEEMEETEWFYYYVFDSNPDITINYYNGETRTVPWYDYSEYFYDYKVTTVQSIDNQFKIGENTATVTFYVEDDGLDDYTIDAELKFQIIENPVKSIKATLNEDFIENTNGYYQDVYGEEDEVIGQYYEYDLYSADITVDITYNDGTTKSYDCNELYSETGYSLYFIGSQYTSPFKLGENKYKVSYLGHETEMTVNIVETPVKSIKATAKRDLIENIDGYVSERYDSATDNWVEYFDYYLEDTDIEFEITYKDGKVETCDYDTLCYDVDNFKILNPQYNSPFKLGKNTLKIAYLGFETEVVVNVVENPIKSISLKAGPINELDGWETEDCIYDENDNENWVTYKAYGLDYGTSTITINYKDATKAPVTLALADVYPTFGYDCSINISQGSQNQLVTGKKYTGEATFMNVSCDFEFEIEPNPVKSISAKATKTLTENRDGNYWYESQNTGFFHYDIYKTQPEITINYIDGTVKTYSYAELDNLEFGYEISAVQSYEKPLEVGENTGVITCAERTCEFKFTIAEDNIESLSLVPTKDLIENVDGLKTSWDGKEYFYYDLEALEPVLTINYKDGTKETYDFLSLYRYVDFDFSLYSNEQHKNPFKLGENTIKLQILGRDVDFKFNLVAQSEALKIKTIEVIPENTLLENTAGGFTSDYNDETEEASEEYYIYNLDLITYTLKVTYENGTTETFTGLSSYDSVGTSIFEILNEQCFENQLKVGKNKVKALFRNTVCEFEVEVVANPYTALEISGENELFFTLTKADGTKETHKVIRYCHWTGRVYTESGRVFEAWLEYDIKYTDKGADIYNYRFNLNIDKDTLQSNVLKSNNWLRLSIALDDVAEAVALYADGYSEQYYGREFSGLSAGPITGTAVDDALTICTYALWPETLTDDKGSYKNISLDRAKYYASNYFDPERFDFKSSPMYDEKTDTIKVYFLNSWEYGVTPLKFEYKDGLFVYTANFVSNYTTKTFRIIVRYEEGIYYVSSIDLHGDHTYDEGVIVEKSTCTKNGTKLFTCECGATYTESVALVPHTDVYVGTKDVHAKCAICGVTTKTEHNFTSKVIKEATATEKGKELFTCACGYSYEATTELHEIGEVNIEVAKTNKFSATIKEIVDVKAKVELTPNEKYLLSQGEDLKIVFKLDELSKEIDTVEKEAISKVLGEKKLGAFLDINLVKQIGNYEGKVEKLNGMIKVSIELPAELKNTDKNVERVFSVIRYHEGDNNKVTVLDATYDKATNQLVFATDRFSTYAIVYEDVSISENIGASEDGKDDVLKTGVISTTTIWLGAMSVSGLGALVLARKKKED